MHENNYYGKHDNNIECAKCYLSFVFKPEETFWDDNGFGYSTKLVKCPRCGRINVVRHKEDIGMDVNNDKRFYSYQ